jgi:hypothetical protein
MKPTLPRDIRLTDLQTAQLIGANLGELDMLTGRSGKYCDPTFPPRQQGSRSANAVLTWVAARDAKVASTSSAIPSEKGSS